MRVLVRLILNDQPGALSVATAAIAAAGGNVLGVDIVDRVGTSVVDDFVVEIAGAEPRELRDELAATSGLIVECVRATPQVELHRELDLISSLVTDPKPSLALLARLVPAIMRCDWAVVISSSGSAATITHSSMHGPRIRWTSLPWLPLLHAGTLDAGEEWVPSSRHGDLVALAAAPIDERTCILVCRTEGPAFRPREVDQLAQLGRLAGGIVRADAGQHLEETSERVAGVT